MSLLVFSGIITPLFSQTKINGIINKYGSVTGIGTDYVIVSDNGQFSQFAAGDTVLLIQMKGVRIRAKEDNLFGTSGFSYGQAGIHEFITISSVDVGNKIIFRNNIVKAFSILGDLQIIKVPSYNYALADATLTCAPWDSASKTGGVLTAIVGRTLSLNANIDVTGKGFKGGAITGGQGICVIGDIPKWNQYAFSGLSDSAGFKGEGLPVLADPNNDDSPPYYPVFPAYAKGYGKNFNGGGGGNGNFSGGGGGSNYGAGGIGGKEINSCSPQYPGGIGGIQIPGTALDGGLFLGGGGGGSTNKGAGTPTAGANGGGIVILICDTLKGNSMSILAEGGAPGTASGNAGSGGGGGGGSIALYLQSYSTIPATSALTISANGGKGGNHTGIFGEGGGGGGGLINTSNIALPGNVTKTVAGGPVGNRSGGPSGTGGAPGKNTTPFVPILNGFLFNSIRSSVTGNQVDSICSDVIPKPITGTSPVGGSGSYSFQWLKSLTGTAPWSVIAGATSKDYSPTLTESSTFWIRRYVKDDITSLKDTSKAVKIIVQPAITGNLVGKDTTICHNQNPLSLIPLNSGPLNGNGHYKYQWVQNPDNVWPASVNAAGTSTSPSYDPPALTATTYYKRIVTSGRCINYSSAVTITVLPSITGNITTRPDSVVCQGSLFNTLGASAPGAGSGSYIYQWQDSITSGIWTPASGIITNPTHAPDTSKFDVTEKRYFRRVVFSGPDDVCRSNSSRILLTRYHKIKNNVISADNMICSGEIPTPLTGTAPTQGNLTYTYQWQDSTKGVPWNTKGTTGSPFSPPSLTDTTWYRRIVNSSVCTNTSNKIVINVHKTVLNNIAKLISGPGPDTTICSGAVPHKIMGTIPTGGTNIPGDYAYQWAFSTDNSTYTDILTSGTLSNYQPGALTVSTWFRRKTISGECTSISNSIKVIVLPTISNNVISVSKPAVCFNTVPATISGTALTGGAGGTPLWIWEQSINGTTWAAASGTGNTQNYSPPALTVKTWYRRIIISGPANCCIDTSNVVTIDINPLPTGVLTSVSDTTICNGNDVLLKVHLTGTSPWKLVYNENSSTVTVNSIASADYIISRIPSATAAMSIFNYSLVSVEDQNACLATSLSGTRKANVYRVPVAEAGPDDEICGPQYKLAAVPSDGTGTWYFPPQVLAPLPVAYNDLVKIDSSFTAASVAYKFYWEEKNWLCVKKDSVTITFYNRIDTISAGPDETIISFDFIARMKAYPIMAYETGKWSVVSGTGDFENDTDISTYVRNISIGANTYKWTVTNGKCILNDLVNFDVAVPVIPQAISPDGDLVNDTLKIGGLDLINQEVELSILNGAGTQVFSTSTKSGWINWYGRNSKGNLLPEGTYYYLLKIKSLKTGLTVSKSGFIILKRN